MMFRAALWPSDGDADAIIHKVPQGGPDGNCGLAYFSNGTSDGQIIQAWNHRTPEKDETKELLREALADMETIVEFLRGTAPLDGVWFHEAYEDGSRLPVYWWRPKLREVFDRLKVTGETQ